MFDTVDSFKAKIANAQAAYRVSETRFCLCCSAARIRVTYNKQLTNWLESPPLLTHRLSPKLPIIATRSFFFCLDFTEKRRQAKNRQDETRGEIGKSEG